MATDVIQKKLVLDIVQGKVTAAEGLKAVGREEDALLSKIKQVDSATKAAVGTQEQFNSELAGLRNTGLDDVNNKIRQIDSSTKAVNSEWDEFNDKVRQGIGEIDDLANKSNKVQAPSATDTAGKAASSIGALGSLAGSLGGGDVGRILQTGAAISNVAKEIPNLGTAVKGLAENVSPAGVVIAAAGAAVALALAATQDAVNQTNAVAKGFFDQRKAEQDFATFDTTQAEAKKAELQKIVDENTKLAVDGEAIKQQTFKETQQAYGDIVARGAFAAAEARGQFSELNKGIEESKAKAAEAQAQLNALNKLEADGTIAANSLATGIDNLKTQFADAKTGGLDFGDAIKSISSPFQEQTKAITDGIAGALNSAEAHLNLGEAVNSTLAPLIQATAAHNKITDVLKSYDASKAETASKRQIAATEAAQDEAIKAADKAEDRRDAALEAAQSHQDKLAQIEDAGDKKVEDLRKQLTDGIGNYAKQINAEQNTLAKLDADYRKSQLKLQEKFNQDRARLERDARNSELDAATEGNFKQLAEIQRQTKAQKQDLRQDFRGNKSDAADQYQEAKDAEQAKIASLNAELEAFKTNQQEKIAAGQQETETALANEERLYQAQEEKRQAAYDKQDTREARAAELRDQRQQAAQLREDAALDTRTAKQLEAIGTVEARQEAATLKASAGFDILELSLNKFTQAALALGGSTAQGIQAAIPNPVTGPKVTAFASGGVATKPTLALIGEDGTEIVSPVEKSKGLPASLFDSGGASGGSAGRGAAAGSGEVHLHVDGSNTVTIQGGADDATVKKFEKMLDQNNVRLAGVVNRSIHAILDGKVPT